MASSNKMTQMRLEFLQNAMKLYKDKSPLIASSCGVTALKLSSKMKQSSTISHRICEACGQILIFGKTKRIRFKTKKRNRNISIIMLSKLMNKTKHKPKLNYIIETCLYCNHKKYSQLSFTSLKYLKQQRLNKLKHNKNRKQVINLKLNNNQSEQMKLDIKQIGLKTVHNLKQFSKYKTHSNRNNNNNQQTEMDRLLGMTSSNNTRLNKNKKRTISNNFKTHFKANKRKQHKWKRK
eukprot:179774_1